MLHFHGADDTKGKFGHAVRISILNLHRYSTLYTRGNCMQLWDRSLVTDPETNPLIEVSKMEVSLNHPVYLRIFY